MPRLARASALASLALAAALALFFFNAKHSPALDYAGPFAEDPYDAVGSAGFQLSLAAALLAALRAFRPGARQPAAVLRAVAVSVFSTNLTVAADEIALSRPPWSWRGEPGGPALNGLLILMGLAGLMALYGLVWVGRRLRQSVFEHDPRAPFLRLALFAGGILVLFVYPQKTDEPSMVAALVAAVAGLVLLPVLTWAAVGRLFPWPGDIPEDGLDDLAAIYNAFCERLGLKTSLAYWEPPARWATLWAALYPRRHPLRLAALAALVCGLGLAAVQIIGEGVRPGSSVFMPVLSVFVGGEALAMLLCYLCFNRYLCLLRNDS